MSNLREVIEELTAEKRWHESMAGEIRNTLSKLHRLHGYSSPVYLHAKDLGISATADEIMAHIEYLNQTEDPEERLKERNALASILYQAEIDMLKKVVKKIEDRNDS